MRQVRQARESADAFQYSVSLTHVPSGKTVEFQEDFGYPGYKREAGWESDPVYLWADGNYSCNCNRDLFFHWNSGDPEHSHNDGKLCDEYDEYRVNWIRNDETKQIIYQEPQD